MSNSNPLEVADVYYPNLSDLKIVKNIRPVIVDKLGGLSEEDQLAIQEASKRYISARIQSALKSSRWKSSVVEGYTVAFQEGDYSLEGLGNVRLRNTKLYTKGQPRPVQSLVEIEVGDVDSPEGCYSLILREADEGINNESSYQVVRDGSKYWNEVNCPEVYKLYTGSKIVEALATSL